MTLQFSKKEKQIGILGVIILILFITGLYFFYLQPLKSALSTKESELRSAEKLFEAVESHRPDDPQSDTFTSTESLQKQIPVKPLVEQLLLDIEKAEIISDSLVLEMEFTDGDIIETPMNESENTNTANEEINTDNTEAEQVDDKKSNIPMPSGMKKTTAVLFVQSPSYFELEKFIETLESQERIILVEKLEINGLEEVISTDQEKELITSQITIATFYMPNLTDLIDQLPKMEVPKPSGKKNPFSISEDISNEFEKEKDDSLEKFDENPR
ncbi:pilus assembly protein PilO [Bacillus sp. FJAT-49705]|uniref:Pilus assembly protein PilO n=1 Tax=Cytobacillus citreus TaxID=2833586 RepID=A0ABS5NUI5_9BACI|nr:pilus assembly protein PilO [Cytobacillus citreus]MBS4191467.1 pilus assembly protein PilO [Cytobacillus citreus]